MRSFILIAVILTLNGLQMAFAETVNRNAGDLFTLVEPFDAEVLETGQKVSSPNLNSKIRQGMRDLLLRLTGDAGLSRSDEGRELIRHAKSWLKNYQFEPRKEEGVTVGQDLVLEFDRQRLLKVFQSKQILVWPSGQRPVTLVMGSYLEGGSLMKLTQEVLGYRPDIEFRSYPELLALPIRFADGQSAWFYPIEDGAGREEIQTALLKNESRNMLAFQVSRDASRRYSLKWQLYNPSAEVILKGEATGKRLKGLMQGMFDRMMAAYSYEYRQSADVLGVASIAISQLSSAEQLIGVERFLSQQKPIVHQVFLEALKGDRAVFEVVYQGGYRSFLERVMAIEESELVKESAVTGEIELRLQGLGDRPRTELIDLSKEYEMIRRLEAH